MQQCSGPLCGRCSLAKGLRACERAVAAGGAAAAVALLGCLRVGTWSTERALATRCFVGTVGGTWRWAGVVSATEDCAVA